MKRVVIVGRPNVGKSSLFNRVVGRREAVVEERPKVTRDAKEATIDWEGAPLAIVDTGGYLAGADGLDAAVSAAVEAALRRADLALVVVDARVPHRGGRSHRPRGAPRQGALDPRREQGGQPWA